MGAEPDVQGDVRRAGVSELQGRAANLARNDIQEWLQDLGGRHAVCSTGSRSAPVTEEPVPTDCSPLVDWRFRLGKGSRRPPWTGTVGRAVGGLLASTPAAVVTLARTPMLNSQGGETGYHAAGRGDRSLTEGAVAARESGRACGCRAESSAIPSSTSPTRTSTGSRRCAARWTTSTATTSSTSPTRRAPGTCTATPTTSSRRRRRDDRGGARPSTIRASRPPDLHLPGQHLLHGRPHLHGRRANGQDGSETFFRARGPAVDVRRAGAGRVDVDRAELHLGHRDESVDDGPGHGQRGGGPTAGDTVTCTYTDRLTPPPAGLSIAKGTLGGVGAFAFRVSGPQRSATRGSRPRGGGVAEAGAPLSLARGEVPRLRAASRRDRGRALARLA